MEYFTETMLDNGILKLQIARPKQLNALCIDLLKELDSKLDSIKADDKVKSILFVGQDKSFSAGADIKEIADIPQNEGEKFALNGQRIFSKLEKLGKVSLSAINGYTFGGGCELCMSTTIRFAGPKACFGQPEIKLALLPGYGGTQRLSRLIGKGRAMDICVTGRTIDSKTAYNWGLVTELFDTEELMINAAIEVLKQISKYSPHAVRLNIDAINDGYDLELEKALELEAKLFGKACSHQDKVEGVSAFIEKREARF